VTPVAEKSGVDSLRTAAKTKERKNDSLLHGNILLVVETSFALDVKNKVLGPTPNTGK
jgi:quinolinate synthase